MGIKNFIKKICFKEKCNSQSRQNGCCFEEEVLLNTFFKRKIQNMTEMNNYVLLNQLYILQNILPEMHCRAFGGYEKYFRGRDIVLLEDGPTLKQYTNKKRIKHAIHIGVDKAIGSCEDLDFYFVNDWLVIQEYGLEDKIQRSNAKKFFAFDISNHKLETVPLEFVKKCRILLYFTMRYMDYQIIQPDISRHPFFGCGSIIFESFQFALYCRPRKIYLIGCDCLMENVKIEGEQHNFVSQKKQEYWKNMASFARYHYPDVEIISINPLGLKGIFKDQYL